MTSKNVYKETSKNSELKGGQKTSQYSGNNSTRQDLGKQPRGYLSFATGRSFCKLFDNFHNLPEVYEHIDQQILPTVLSAVDAT